MIAFITVTNLLAAIHLFHDILTNNKLYANNATGLLATGGVIWATNVIAFALWYWDLDRGGAAARAHRPQANPAFIFPEMLHPQYVPAPWVPKFVDYLSLGFWTATAFSPTDISANRPWAKLLMITEAAVSLGIAGLVIARDQHPGLAAADYRRAGAAHALQLMAGIALVLGAHLTISGLIAPADLPLGLRAVSSRQHGRDPGRMPAAPRSEATPPARPARRSSMNPQIACPLALNLADRWTPSLKPRDCLRLRRIKYDSRREYHDSAVLRSGYWPAVTTATDAVRSIGGTSLDGDLRSGHPHRLD